jgi:opacity protein-like surface antigen
VTLHGARERSRTTLGLRWMVLVLGVTLLSHSARAQTLPTQAPSKSAGPARSATPRFEVSAGVGWWSSVTLGEATAEITDSQTPTGGDFPLFRTSTEIGSAPVFTAGLGYRISRRWGVEAGLEVGKPEVRTTVRDDVEASGTTTAVEKLTQVIVDGAVVYRLTAAAKGRLVPFVRGGVGYLRQLHEGRNEVETGQAYSAGGGVLWAFLERPRGLKAFGLRGDVRAEWLRGGFELEESRGATMFAGVGAFLRF